MVLHESGASLAVISGPSYKLDTIWILIPFPHSVPLWQCHKGSDMAVLLSSSSSGSSESCKRGLIFVSFVSALNGMELGRPHHFPFESVVWGCFNEARLSMPLNP
jgi:hypothetical protein